MDSWMITEIHCTKDGMMDFVWESLSYLGRKLNQRGVEKCNFMASWGRQKLQELTCTVFHEERDM